MWRQTLNLLKFRTTNSPALTSLLRSQPSIFNKQLQLRHFSPVINTDEDVNEDNDISCLTLHPVTWPNHGPQVELYLAEEAIGLVKSLDWKVVKGPMWQDDNEEVDHIKNILNEEDQQHFSNFFDEKDLNAYNQGSRKKIYINPQKVRQTMKKENIRDGDFIYGPDDLRGVYYKRGGVILEMDEQDDDNDLQDEWKNVLLRESVAKSSLIKVRKIHSGTFFTKGKLNDLGYFIKENKSVNVVFINSQLTALQQKKLEKEEKLRRYNLKSAQKEKYNPTDVESESTQMSDVEDNSNSLKIERKIRVIDRFGIILQIFAQRARSRAAQLQIELAWLKYARTMLVRGGAPTFGQLGNIFQGNMMRLDISEVEIKSARGRKSGSSGVIGGEGETQLEMERRRIGDREAKILKELQELDKRMQHEKIKKERTHQTLPLIALIGYTNAGKTALINLMTGSHLESKDLLFQTLNTTNKRFLMPNGQFALMLDTVGFITNLPHGLVESFKVTLDEIHYADILVHVRDISHPHTNYQRNAVLKVLKEIGIPEETLQTKYVEVWNKIDLVQDRDALKEQLIQDQSLAAQAGSPQLPVIMMSCTKGTGRTKLLDTLQTLSTSLMGKRLMKISYPYSDHNKVTKWFMENASISTFDHLEFNEDGSIITIQVPLDDVVYEQYKKKFMQVEYERDRGQYGGSNKLRPPPGWNN